MILGSAASVYREWTDDKASVATGSPVAPMEYSQVEFQIGDNVRDGIHVGTVTDVGTVLIQVKTTDGRLRVVCPWELVKTRDGEQPRMRRLRTTGQFGPAGATSPAMSSALT
jgi:hypothetical protein